MNVRTPVLIGICGGSCSGKTTLSRWLLSHYGPATASLVLQDNYYRTNGGVAHPGDTPNFDHPDSIDFVLLLQHIEALRRGQTIDCPVYDFVTHSRTDQVEPIAPRPIILVEGILILSDAPLREALDLSVFIECSAELRLKRRLARDTVERGRTEASVLQQFETQVNPMHEQFVQANAHKAGLVLSQPEYRSEVAGESTAVLQAIAAFGAG